MFDVIFFLLTFLAFTGLIIGLIKPNKVIRWGEKKNRKQVVLIYGLAIIVFFILFVITISSPEKKGEIKPEITQPSEQEEIAKSSQQEVQKETTKQEKTSSEGVDPKTYSTVIDKIETYKLPVKSGKWQTCIVNQINSLSNIGLLQFQYWLLSLSSNPMMDEIEITVVIARKLGCPEPTVRTIPAKIEVIKSWQGAGSKNLGSYTPSIDNWEMKITWQNSPFNEDFGNDEFAADRRLLFDYGIVDYEEGASITSSPLISAFYSPSGNEERGSSYLGYTHFDILRVKAPEQVTWEVEVYKIIEPEKTIIE